MSSAQQIEEAIGEANIYVSRVRDEYENVLEEFFKLFNKKERSEEEVRRLGELIEMRNRIEDYIHRYIKDDFSSPLSRMMKNKNNCAATKFQKNKFT